MKPILLLLALLTLAVNAYPQSKPSLPITTAVPKTLTVTAPAIVTVLITNQDLQRKSNNASEKKSQIDTTLDIAGLAAMLGLIVAFITIGSNSRLNTKAISVARFQEIYKEYTSDDFRLSLSFVRNDLQTDYPPNDEITFYDLKDKDVRHATRVSHFFDFVGMLVAEKLLDEDLIVIFLGGSAERTWKKLHPYIDNIRTKSKDDNYQAHFENLAAITFYKPEEERLKKYNLKKYPALPVKPDNPKPSTD